VPGPFLCEPSPQRTPLLFQAGSSPSGLAFAARHAEAVFFSEPGAAVLAPKVARLRELAGRAGRDPGSVAMCPATVADEMERWIDVAEVDGFNLAYAITPGTFEDIVEYLVPELQDRGRLRTSYEGSTLRESFSGAGRARLRDDHPGARYRRAPG
jgi:alkanesulfonate monooxygenase SsuD/methylene tetrahydromethanopterin reductase-like flavin-dependent oxidoreductase (luciferase family)